MSVRVCCCPVHADAHAHNILGGGIPSSTRRSSTYLGENGLTDGNGKSSNEEIPMNKISSLYL